MINHVHPILCYSAFGCGKTTLWAELFKQLRTGDEKMRIYTAEHANSIQADIDTGLVEVWKLNTRDHPFDTLRMACKGWWPEDPADPDSRILPPTPETWVKYPFRAYEGMATFSNYLATNHSIGGLLQRAANGESIGFDEGGKVQFDDGGTSVGGSTRTTYGIIQKEIQGLIQVSQRRPGYVFWSTHEDTIFQKGTGLPLFSGPEVFGGALTSSIGREFADVWRISPVTTNLQDAAGNVRSVTERRLYVKDHVQDGIPCKARNSGGLGRQKDVSDYYRMSENGLPLMDTAERVVRGLWPERLSPHQK